MPSQYPFMPPLKYKRVKGWEITILNWKRITLSFHVKINKNTALPYQSAMTFSLRTYKNKLVTKNEKAWKAGDTK